VAPLDCLEGTVPGWLDESGQPTSCVGDDPLVEPSPELGIPQDVFPSPLPLDVLANTGPVDDLAAWIALACGLMLAGWMVWVNDRMKRGRS